MARTVVLMRQYDATINRWHASNNLVRELKGRRIFPTEIIASPEEDSQNTGKLLQWIMPQVGSCTRVATVAWEAIVSDIRSELHIPLVIVDAQTADRILSQISHPRSGWLSQPGCCSIIYFDTKGKRRGDMDLLNPNL